jgi:hypothetical protein
MVTDWITDLAEKASRAALFALLFFLLGFGLDVLLLLALWLLLVYFVY